MDICRHKTAISRSDLSKPVRLALLSGIINVETTVFDYGCGRGIDVKFLNFQGIKAVGYDSHYFPEKNFIQSDIVMLNYVLNVIEIPEERLDVLRFCYELAIQGLLIAVRLLNERPKIYTEYGDGVLTKRKTFQKFFTKGEFKSYLYSSLGVEPEFLSSGIAVILKE